MCEISVVSVERVGWNGKCLFFCLVELIKVKWEYQKCLEKCFLMVVLYCASVFGMN